tara:strand:- start:1435 stop:3375 length:1941 start_codon:yes stop_codon:yes gene_type:complete
MLDLSKDKSFRSSLLKANLDNKTLELVESHANISSIKKSLIMNIDANNIIEYRKLITKAEEEENRALRQETKKITKPQFKTLVSLYSKLEGIPETEVDRTKIPLEREPAKKLIAELRAELKTRQTIGQDESDDDASLSEIGELEGGTTFAGKTKEEKTKEAAKRTDLIREKNLKDDARKNLLKAQNWLLELQELDDKLSITALGDEVVIKRMNEYEKFGGNITESNEVINLVKDNLNYKGSESGYLVAKYKNLLQTFDEKNKDVLVPITVSNKTGKPVKQMNKLIFVGNLQEGYDKLLQKKYLKKFTLLDILESMHRKRHGRQPKSSFNPQDRKTELEGMMNILLGKTPKDDSRFNKLKRLVKGLKNSIATNSGKLTQFKERIKELKELENDVDELVARKIRRLMGSLNTLRGFDKVQEASNLISEIRENPDKYVNELKEELLEDIEKEQAKVESIVMVLESQESVSRHITRVSKAIRQVEVFTEDTGRDISGELKEIFARLPVHIINLKRYAKKISKKTAEADDIIERAFAEWGLEDNKTLTINSSGISFEGVSDIGVTDIESLEKLKSKFTQNVGQIDNIMNELDGLLQVFSKKKDKDYTESDESWEEDNKERVEEMKNRNISQPKLPRGDTMGDYDYGDYGED